MNDSPPKFIREILQRKNISADQEIQNFLYPQLQNLKPPFQMNGMHEAAELVIAAVQDSTTIIIWGDYDVDGTTGTSLLVNFFRSIGVESQWYIPDRLTEGYGLHLESFINIHKDLECKDFLLITVDCGISNSSEIADIVKLGGKAIVTDHHQLPPDSLPECVILNPSQEDCGFHGEHLAGVGVAFYLAAAVRSRLEQGGYFKSVVKPNMKDFLGYVALGSLADIVELSPTNRILVKAGMESLTNAPHPGLKSLMKGADIHKAPITSEDIGFTIGPRINAAGRLGSANITVDLLTCLDNKKGSRLSKKLQSLNDERKRICTDNFDIASDMIERMPLQSSRTIVLQGDYHQGVLGIVASKIVEVHRKPTIVFGLDAQHNGRQVFKGSGRSLPGINLIEILHKCREHIIKYGGHEMAAGLSVDTSTMELFKLTFEQLVASVESPLKDQHVAGNEFHYSVDEIFREKCLEYFVRLEPFGPGNEKPVFVDTSAEIVSCRLIGAGGDHLQLLIRGKYKNYRGVGFGLGNKYDEIRDTPQRTLRYTPILNRYRGATDWQIRVLDI